VWAPRRPRHVRARARQCERRAGGVVSSSPTVCQVAQLAHMGRRPRPRVDPPAAAAASAAVGRAPYERGAWREGKPAAQTKQAGRVASSTPLASVHGTRIVLRQRDSPRGPVGRRRGRCSAKASRGRAGRGALVVWPAPRPRAHRAGRARRDGTDGEDREGRGEDGMKASSSCLHVIDGWWQWLVNQVVACTLESVAFWGRKPLGVAN
jgi:hypothetical protein